MSGGNGPRGALRVGARVRFDERVFTVAGLEGTMVRLLDDRGVARYGCLGPGRGWRGPGGGGGGGSRWG